MRLASHIILHFMTHKFISVLALSILFYCTQAQSVGIGTPTPHSSALLDVSSAGKGLLAPRMTTAQRNAIANPAKGLLVYDTDINNLFHYNGTGWQTVGQAGNGFSLPFDGSISIDGPAFRVGNAGTAIEGHSNSGSAINAVSNSGAAVNALSSTGFGVAATSVGSTALYGFSNNQFPTIRGVNTNGMGVAVQGNSSFHHAVVGISGGTSKAGVRGEATGLSGIGVFGTANGETGVGVYGSVTSGTAVYGLSTSGVGVRALSASGLALEVNGNLRIAGGNTTPSNGAVLTSDAQGNATWKNNRIAFRATGVNENFNGLSSGTYARVHFGTEHYDYGNHYLLHVGSNPGTTASTFMAPVDGVYHFDAAAEVTVSEYLNNIQYANIRLRLNRNGVLSTIAIQDLTVDDNLKLSASGNISTGVRLQAGDRVFVEVRQVSSGPGNVFGGPNALGAYFTGHLVFAD